MVVVPRIAFAHTCEDENGRSVVGSLAVVHRLGTLMANPGDALQYRVVPMIGPDKHSLRADSDRASDWTEEVELTHGVTPAIDVYFNRGIAAAQWVSRRLGVADLNLQGKKLEKVIATSGDPFQAYLAGPLGVRLFELLASAAAEKREIYAAL